MLVLSRIHTNHLLLLCVAEVYPASLAPPPSAEEAADRKLLQARPKQVRREKAQIGKVAGLVLRCVDTPQFAAGLFEGHRVCMRLDTQGN